MSRQQNTNSLPPDFYKINTAEVPAVQPAIPTVQPVNVFTLLNQMLDMKLATVIIRKQKIQYSILSFKEYNDEWMLCEVENVSGNVSGDDLVILVQKTTPIIVYAIGPVRSPFN